MKKIFLRYSVKSFLLLAVIFFYNDSFATTITSTSNGNWTTAGTWDLNRVPQNGDTIIVDHAVAVPTNTTVSLNGVAIFIYVSLNLANKGKLILNSTSIINLGLAATISRSTGNGALTIDGTDLTVGGSGLQKTGPDQADLSGWGASLGTLPVSLVSFLSETFEDKVELKWETASEVNNDYFVVERMVNDEWEAVGQVVGNGTTNQINYYTYTDHEVDVTVNAYYRLRQIDFDGKEDLSDIIKSEVMEAQSHKYQFIQKGSLIAVNFLEDHKELTQVQVLTAEGKIIFDKSFDNVFEGQSIEFSLSEYSGGWYVLGIIGVDNAHFEKMILVN